MEKKAKDKFAEIIFHIVSGLMAVMFVCGVFFVSGKPDVSLKINPPQTLSEDWYYSVSHEPITDSVLTFEKNEIKIIEHEVPLEYQNGFALGVYNYFLNIQAFQNNSLIFEGGSRRAPLFGKETGDVWQIIQFEHAKPGDKITLKLYSPSSAGEFAFNELLIGSTNEINFYIFRPNNKIMMIVIILLVFIVLGICYILILNYYKVTRYLKQIVYLTLLCADAVVFFCFETTLSQYVTGNPAIQYLLSYFSFFSMSVFIMLLLRECFQKSWNMFTNIMNVYGIIIVVILILYWTNVVNVLYSLIVVHLFLPVIIVCSFIAIIKDYKVTHDKLDTWGIIALVILSIGTIMSVADYRTEGTVENIDAFSLAFLGFIIIFMACLLRCSLRALSEVRDVEHYKKIAYIDPITGGNTAAYFAEQMSKIPVVKSYFLIVNLIQFKLINQIIGRQKSDELLKDLYKVISETLSEDELMCSLGNARFGICFTALDSWEMQSRCKKILECIHEYTHLKKISINLATQFSLCQVTESNKELNVLIDCALMARDNPNAKYIPEINAFVYNDECTKQLLSAKLLEDRLDSAIENGEFRLYLQPKISLTNGIIEGAEVLVRWMHPVKGLIPPDEFIPLFEHDGQIEKLDLYTFTEICKLIKRWVEDGFEPPVISINVSKLAIKYEGYFKRYMEIIKEYDVPGKYLEFELTESIAYDNIEHLRSIFQEIHSIGAKCAMDDFGKSYSNVTALGALSFDTAKMDKCFFDGGFPNDNKKLNLVSGAIQLLRSLNLNIVAEGIEEEDQVTALRTIGCDVVQGFYFAKPMPVGVFEQYCQMSK